MRTCTKIDYLAKFANMCTDCKSPRIFKVFFGVISYSYPMMHNVNLDVTVHHRSAFHTITVLCYITNGDRVLVHIE